MTECHTVQVSFQISSPGKPLGAFSNIRVGVLEDLHCELVDNEWVITNPQGHASWIGRAPYKNDAVLQYLRARLGLMDQ